MSIVLSRTLEMRKVLLRLITLICLLSFSLISQSQTVNEKLTAIENMADSNAAILSVNALLHQSSLSTVEKLSSLTLRGKIYHQLGQLDNAIASAEEERQLAFMANMPQRAADAAKRTGVYAYYQGDQDLAVTSYRLALDFYLTLDEPILQANLLNNIALALAATGDLEGALAHYQQAEPLYIQYGSAQDKVDLRFNIAGLHLRLKRYDTAISMFLEVIERRIELDDNTGLALAYGDLGSSYKYAGEYEKAQSYMIKGLEFHLRNKSYYNAASLLHNLAELNNYRHNVEQAIAYAKEGIRLSIAQEHNVAYSGSLYSLATAYFHQGELELALKHVDKSTEVASEMNYAAQLNHNIALKALIFAAQNKPIEAINHYRLFLKGQMEISNDQLNTKLALFDSKQLKQQVTQLTQQQRLKELEVEKTEQKRNFAIVAIVCILLIAFIISRRDIERRSKLALERKVKQRTNELEHLMQELQSANKIKSQFLANMSHEIRTPLTTVIGQAEAIISGDVEEEFISKEVEIIHGNSLHLLELTNNILDLSKIEANKIELELHQQDLHSILQELANMFVLQASSKGLTFEIIHALPQPFIVEVDGFRVKQILINLCSNAIKFTPKGHVELNVIREDEQLIFKITDSGIGMSSSQLHNLFESFTQGDSSISRRFGGTGLGLCLSDQLAKIMGGSIEVESELNQGSVFVFSIPVDSVSSPDEIKSSIVSPNPNKNEKPVTQISGKILLADDHNDNRRLIARLLSSLGLEVISARNGQEAVALYQAHTPELILMDIQMPEMDGIEAFKILRQKGCDKPIIALTANAMSHEIKHYLTLGFNGHLSKPIDRTIFITTIMKYYDTTMSHQTANEKFDQVGMSDLVLEFKSNLVLEQQDLVLHINQNDLQKLARLSHRIAGAAQMFGYAQLSKAALALEMAIKKDKTDDVNNLAQYLLNEIDQVLW